MSLGSDIKSYSTLTIGYQFPLVSPHQLSLIRCASDNRDRKALLLLHPSCKLEFSKNISLLNLPRSPFPAVSIAKVWFGQLLYLVFPYIQSTRLLRWERGKILLGNLYDTGAVCASSQKRHRSFLSEDFKFRVDGWQFDGVYSEWSLDNHLRAAPYAQRPLDIRFTGTQACGFLLFTGPRP